MMSTSTLSPNYYGAESVDWKLYKEFRPHYPTEIFDILKRYLKENNPTKLELAVDYGTATGTIVKDLLQRCGIQKVLGTDLNERSLQDGLAFLRGEGYGPDTYSVRVGKAGGFDDIEDESVDVVTAAEAAHWFEHEKWVAECARILRPGGTLAFWFYPYWCQIPDYPEATVPLHRIWQAISLHLNKNAKGGLPKSLMRAVSSLLGSIVVPKEHFERQVHIKRLLPDNILDKIDHQVPELAGSDKEDINKLADAGIWGHEAGCDFNVAESTSQIFVQEKGWNMKALLHYIETLNFVPLKELLADESNASDIQTIQDIVGGESAKFDVGWNFGMVLATKRGAAS